MLENMTYFFENFCQKIFVGHFSDKTSAKPYNKNLNSQIFCLTTCLPILIQPMSSIPSESRSTSITLQLEICLLARSVKSFTTTNESIRSHHFKAHQRSLRMIWTKKILKTRQSDVKDLALRAQSPQATRRRLGKLRRKGYQRILLVADPRSQSQSQSQRMETTPRFGCSLRQHNPRTHPRTPPRTPAKTQTHVVISAKLWDLICLAAAASVLSFTSAGFSSLPTR